MDSNSDEENNGFNKKDDEFLGKEHFYGESGEKLMKLQQTFGHDERFKMDERFLDSDREMETKSQTPVFEKDDLSKELTEEKIMSLKILSDVLGTNSMWVGENEDPRNLYRDSVDTRYDPSRQDHIKFEEDMARPDSPKQNDENYVVDKIPETDEPVATQEKYYNVSDSIKSLFSDKDKECSTFSFFPELEGKKDDVETSNSLEIEETIGWKAPVKLSQALPYDSSESESDEDAALPAADVIPSKVNTKRSLFYHPEDQAMMETLEAESSSFIRKESVDDLTRYWVEVRQQLTQDYKKKRKDALRRQKRRVER